MPDSLLLDAASLSRALTRIAHEVVERNESGADVVLVGVQTGGVHIAHRLAKTLGELWGQPIPCGSLDVNMHRDDLANHLAPTVHPTRIPGDITGKTVVLVDDVLFSGRTTRAALDALNDFGRPRRVQLAVLIDRGHRELPIKADFIGKKIVTRANERVNVKLNEADGEDSVWLVKNGAAVS
ncbi:MAG: bifunctional pyr operon transcriptional regulator/uracil phosphoribosyltransferase PyrR [Verrucomicrobia bacterium]|nr:bifunctional pyr operon transcriptional regulator/uracil phosphoribosyltransferase PyrR [Verrucomicrobiota bacterium]